MIGRWKVLSPHAELKAGQSGSKCAPVPCGKGKGGGKHGAPASYPFLYSVSRIAEIVIAAREAKNHFARGQMLSYSAARTFFRAIPLS